MDKDSGTPKKVSWWPLWLTFLGIIFLWGMSIIVLCWLFPNIGVRGQFGDTFGAVNALFAGFAFAGIIFAIILQKKELELQRQELKETRDEIRGQKEQLQAQDQTLKKQNFESSFFHLLSLHNEIVSSMMIIEYGSHGLQDIEYSGRRFFIYLNRELKKSYNEKKRDSQESIATLTSTEIKEEIKAVCEQFFDKCQPHVGHYFRYLYNTIKFVDEHEFFDNKSFIHKKLYTNLIRAQLSSTELGLLFYNCRTDRGSKFIRLVERYSLFEDMDFEQLLNEKHRSLLYAESAYGESSKKKNQ